MRTRLKVRLEADPAGRRAAGSRFSRILGPTAILLLPLAPAAARADVGDYLGKPIASIRLETEGRRTVDDRLLAIMPARVGSPLSMRAVRETVAHLFSLGEFEDVRVHATNGERGVDLLFALSPVHPVHRVLFTGVAGVPGVDEGRLRREVAERFGASPGSGRAADMARLVEAALAQRGYLQARVTPRIQLEHAPDRATIVLAVQPGARTHVAAVDVLGTPGLPVPELLGRLGITNGAPYRPDALAKRIDDYLTDRRERGYYEARLTATPRLADGDRTVHLTLDVSQGPRVRLVFTGDPLPADVREELVPIAREGSADEDLLEDSSNRIVEYVRAQGYRDASVVHERIEADGELVVTFAVDRGPQYRVADVTISGNTFISSEVLYPTLRLRQGQPFQAARLDADVSAIQDLYRRRGFASVKVDASDEPAPDADPEADVPVVVRIDIVEHAQTLVGSVLIDGNESVAEGELLEGLGLRPGVEFFATQMAIDRDAVQLTYANLGFLSATVESNPGLSADGRRADVLFSVREGPRLFVEHVLIAGNRRTRADTIERELQIQAGDPLGVGKVTESQRRLTALGLFRRTRIAQLAHGDETARDLLITVEEAPPTTLGYGGGFEAGQRIRQSAGIASEQLEFAPRAFFEITRRNLFGKNRSVNLFTRVSLRPQDDESTDYGFSEYRVLGTFREPRVFGSVADAFLTATTEQQRRSSFNFARQGFSAEIGQRLTRAVSLIGSYQIQRTELFDEKIDEDDRLIIDRFFPQVLLSSFSAAAIHDTRDDQLDPASGQYFSANGQLAARRIGSQVGLAKSFLTAQLFRTLPGPHRVVLATSARLGIAAGFERQVVRTDERGEPLVGADGQPIVEVINDLPASERFFAGGDTTVRGFALDQLGTADIIDKNGFPIGGNALVIFNAELRVPLRGGLGLVGFFDSGNVFARTTDIDLGQLRSAVGFGFRYRSPIGPIRIDLGFKVNRRDLVPGRPEPRNAWHISLGQAF